VFELYFAHFALFSAADDVRLCNLCGLVDNYHEREIKYEGFGGRPSVGVRPGPPAPLRPCYLHGGFYIKFQFHHMIHDYIHCSCAPHG